MEVVQQYATANGFVMVLDVSNPQSPVLWHNPATDITTDIIKLYDQAHPAAAKAVAPAPPAAKK
jgi:outer membrane protein